MIHPVHSQLAAIENSLPEKSAIQMVTLLSWLDMLERLDTLILELRHIQVNIAYLLRTPDLNRVLRFEEDFLWGGTWTRSDWAKHSWLSLFNRQPSPTPEQFAAYAIPRLPLPFPESIEENIEEAAKSLGHQDNSSWKYGHPPSIREKILFDIKSLVEKYWGENQWSTPQKRYYHLTCQAQALKSNILRDKFLLSHWGARCFRLLGDDENHPDLFAVQDTELARFMMMRAVIMARTGLDHRFVHCHPIMRRATGAVRLA